MISPSGVNFFSMSYDKDIWPGYCPWTGVGSLSAGVPAPQCCLHEEKRAPKVLPSTTSGQSDGPLAPLHLDPFRVHRHRNTEDHQAGLLGGVHSSTQCAPPPMVWWVYEGAVPRAHQTYGPGLAYRVNLGLLGPLQEAEDAPMAVLPHRPVPPQLGLRHGVGQVTML